MWSEPVGILLWLIIWTAATFALGYLACAWQPWRRRPRPAPVADAWVPPTVTVRADGQWWLPADQ